MPELREKLRAQYREKPGVQPDDAMSEAGRKVLAYHVVRLMKEEPGVRNGDVEAVHDMRVATRRLRSALRLFGPFFQGSAIKPLRRKLREVAEALGHVRDLDVFHQKLDTYLKDRKRGQDFEQLLDSLQERQQKARTDLVAFLDSQRYTAFVDELMRFVATPGQGARVLQLDNGEPTPFRVREVAPRLIYEEYGLIRAYEPLLPEASLDTLHELRIQAKRLRYMLEAFAEVLGPEVKLVIEAAKNLQDYLGELQDARIAVAMLQDHLHTAPSRNTKQVRSYVEARKTEQQTLREGVLQTWAAYTDITVRRALALAVSVL